MMKSGFLVKQFLSKAPLSYMYLFSLFSFSLGQAIMPYIQNNLERIQL